MRPPKFDSTCVPEHIVFRPFTFPKGTIMSSAQFAVAGHPLFATDNRSLCRAQQQQRNGRSFSVPLSVARSVLQTIIIILYSAQSYHSCSMLRAFCSCLQDSPLPVSYTLSSFCACDYYSTLCGIVFVLGSFLRTPNMIEVNNIEQTAIYINIHILYI